MSLARLAAPLALLLASACGAVQRPPLDLQEGPRPTPQRSLVWVGRGEAERQDEGGWRRVPEFDYEFTVVQHRYADRWESVKTLRRLHPRYDGSAGPREQVMSFRVDYGPGEGDVVPATVRSSLGAGRGTTDHEFRRATLELAADVSKLAPFDTYRIVQDYRYEEGRLSELVELVDHAKGGERAWVRNREEARLFAAQGR